MIDGRGSNLTKYAGTEYPNLTTIKNGIPKCPARMRPSVTNLYDHLIEFHDGTKSFVSLNTAMAVIACECVMVEYERMPEL